MAKGVFIQVDGFKELQRRLGKLPQTVVQEMDAEMSAAADHFVDRAVAAAPVDTGILKNGITHARLAPLQYEIVSNAFYSAYNEFGTITQVRVPAGLEAYAAQFKGRGIRKTGGMPARPFFFPQVPKAREEVMKAGKRILKDMLK